MSHLQTRHLSQSDIEALNSDAKLMQIASEHLEACEQCAQRVAAAQRVEAALQRLSRIEPAPDLSARIIARLPRTAVEPMRTRSPWLGAAAFLSALLGLVLAYQTAFDLRMNGVFELVSYYTSQPAIVTTYPNEAFGALWSAIPWATLVLSFAVLAMALLLVMRATQERARA